MNRLCYLAVGIVMLTGLESQNILASQADSEMNSSNMGNIVVQGEPPLTKPMVNNLIGLTEWALGLRLSASQKTAATAEMIREWMSNDRASMSATGLMSRIYEDLPNIAEPARTGLRAYVRALILQSLYQDPDDMDGVSLLAAFHERNNCHGPCPDLLREAASQMLETQTGNFIQFAAKYHNHIEINNRAVPDVSQKPSVDLPKSGTEGVKSNSFRNFFNLPKSSTEGVGSKSLRDLARDERWERNFINKQVLGF